MWDPELATGSKLGGRYLVGPRLAAGSTSALYEGQDTRTGKLCTLDVRPAEILRACDARVPFEHEARVGGYLGSEFVARALAGGIDEHTGLPFAVLEPLSGETLTQRLERVGPLGRQELLHCFWQIARALDKAHTSSLLHADLTPDNVFLVEGDDGLLQVKLLGFGIGKLAANAHGALSALGMSFYRAPEQLRTGAAISAQTDICSFGLLAYTALVGTPYFQEDASEAADPAALDAALRRGRSEPPTARAARKGVVLSPRFDVWFARATAPDPGHRFATVVKTVVGLDHAIPSVLGDSQASTPPARRALTTSSDEWQQPRRRWSLFRAGIAAAAVITLVAGLVWALRTPPAAPPPNLAASAPPAVVAIEPLAHEADPKAALEQPRAAVSGEAPAPPPPPARPAPKPRPRRKGSDPMLLDGI